MTIYRKWAFAILLMALMASGLAEWMRPTKYLTDVLGKPDLEAIFPEKFSTWRLDPRAGVILPSPETQALLNKIYNQTLTRTYVNASGQRVMLSVAYGGDQSDSTRAHLPEVCYPAQGFQILDNKLSSVELAGRSVPLRQLMTQQGNRNEPLMYWLVVGHDVTVSRTDQRMAQLKLGLSGLIPDGMLVRVSSIDVNMERGTTLQKQFLQDLSAAIPPAYADRIFGTRKN